METLLPSYDVGVVADNAGVMTTVGTEGVARLATVEAIGVMLLAARSFSNWGVCSAGDASLSGLSQLQVEEEE